MELSARDAAILGGMTLLEITYELQSPLNNEQLRKLGEFANTYGLRRFRVDETAKRLTFEYDASRLKETEVPTFRGTAAVPLLTGLRRPTPRISLAGGRLR